MKKSIWFIVLVSIVCLLFYFEKKTILFDTNQYDNYITEYSDYFNVDSLLVKAVMKKESKLNPDIVSNKGAVGLMQIMPKTALEIAKHLNIEGYSNEQLKEIKVNIMFGTYYLHKLLSYYNNNLILTLAAYNAGIGNVENWHNENPRITEKISAIPFKETRYYVRSVIFTYKVYKGVEKLKSLLTI